MRPVLDVRLGGGFGEQRVLNAIHFQLKAGERLGLLGHSGSGKSTLLFALLGLLPQRRGWAEGEVLVNGVNILELPKREARKLRGRVISLVPQSSTAALNPVLSLQTHFEQYWLAHQPKDRSQLRSRMQDILQRVQLPSTADFLQRKPGQISVGQAQRCTLALALLHRPAIILADEPTSSLDPVNQTEVLDLIRQVSDEQGTAVLFVSHDLLSVLRLCSGVAVLADGRIAEQLPVHDIVHARHSALQQLLRALPVPAEVLLQHMHGRAAAPMRSLPPTPALQMRAEAQPVPAR